MFGKNFELNEETMYIVEELGRHMPGGFFIYKAEGDEELLYANHAVIKIFGCDDLEDFKRLTGYTFKGMLHPEDYKKVSESVGEQIRKSEEKLDYVEYRIIRKDGIVRWVDDYGHYTDTESYGGIYYVFISDVTEKHEQAIQKERQALMSAQKTEEENKRLDKMITALASDYRSVYHIDLDNNDGVCYRGDCSDLEQPEHGWNLEKYVIYKLKSGDYKVFVEAGDRTTGGSREFFITPYCFEAKTYGEFLERYLEIVPGSSFGLKKKDLAPNKELKKFLGYNQRDGSLIEIKVKLADEGKRTNGIRNSTGNRK